MKNKKVVSIVFIILSIALVVIALVTSTYALFSTDSYGANPNSYSTGLLLIEANSKSENISLTSALPMTDSEGVLSTPYVFTITNTGNLDYEFNIELHSTGDENTTFLPQYIKLQIDNGDVVTLGELPGGVIKSNVLLLAGESIDISIRAWLSINTPNTELGKTFNSKIVTNGKAVYTESNNFIGSAADYITNLYLNGEKTVVPYNEIDYNYVTSEGLMNDRLGSANNDINSGNIRYYGINPDNYVYFNCDTYPETNCESWRIIGVFDDKLKIIKSTSLGQYVFDYTSTGQYDNNWHDATLMTLLNDVYYEGGTADYYNGSATPITVDFSSTGLKNSDTRNMVFTNIWYLGGTPNSKPSLGYLDEVYYYEKNQKIQSIPIMWSGKIALMSASDYGYATDLSSCKLPLHQYSDSSCKDYDWLNLNSWEWILTPREGGGWHIFSGAVNNIGPSTGINNSNEVRPTLFLNSEVSILFGDGTEGNPYRLSF